MEKCDEVEEERRNMEVEMGRERLRKHASDMAVA